MCECNGELVHHFFLHFPIAMDLWSMVLGLFGGSWVMQSQLWDLGGLVVIGMVIHG